MAGAGQRGAGEHLLCAFAFVFRCPQPDLSGFDYGLVVAGAPVEALYVPRFRWFLLPWSLDQRAVTQRRRRCRLVPAAIRSSPRRCRRRCPTSCASWSAQLGSWACPRAVLCSAHRRIGRTSRSGHGRESCGTAGPASLFRDISRSVSSDKLQISPKKSIGFLVWEVGTTSTQFRLPYPDSNSIVSELRAGPLGLRERRRTRSCRGR